MNEIVRIINNEAITTTLTIAEGVGNQHKNVLAMVRQYQADLEGFGRVAFETRPRLEGQHGGGDLEIAILNERQAMLLLSYMRNTDVIREFKKNLIMTFYRIADELNRLRSARENLVTGGNFPLYDPPVVVDGGFYGLAVVNRAALLMQINRDQAMQLLFATGLTSYRRQIDRIPEQDRRELALKVELLKAKPLYNNIYYYKVRGLNHQEIATLCKQDVRTIRRSVRKMEELGLLYREVR